MNTGEGSLRDKWIRLLRPFPVYLLFTGNLTNGDINVMALSWVTPISERPPIVGIVVEKRNFSYKLLKKYSWFTLAVTSKKDAELVKYVGTWSKREIDKISTTGIELEAWERDPRVPVPRGFPAILVFRVIREVDFDISELFVGRLEYLRVDKTYFNPDLSWAATEAPLMHLSKHWFVLPGERIGPILWTPWGVAVKRQWRNKLKINDK